MKKNIKGLYILVFAIMMLIPISVFAEEKAYEYFDFKLNMVNGEKIKDTNIKIYASIEDDEENLIDRTDEFNIDEIMWSVCDTTNCTSSREVEDDAVFEEDKDYVFMIRIAAKNGADIDVWGTDKAMFNGTPIEKLEGEFGNTGSELMIKSKIVDEKVIEQEDDLIEESEEPTTLNTTDTKEEIKTTGEEKTCVLGLSLCCTTFLGISLCIWILIAILIILLIIIICILKNKKNNN